jgi:Flp pilus assembly protein TadD
MNARSFVLLVALAGCASGSAAPAPVSPVLAPVGSASATPNPSPSLVAAPIASASLVAAPIASASLVAAPIATTSDAAPGPLLPAPQAPTLPLSSGGDSPFERALASGDRAFEGGNLDAAAREYEAAKATAPSRAEPWVGLARVRVARTGLPLDYAAGKGNSEILAATRELRRAVQVAPTLGAAVVELGRALLLAGDAEGAKGTLRQGVLLLPAQAEAHSVLGVALLATGHREEALTELGRAVSLDSGSAARHGNLGTVLFMNGRVPEAISEYEIQARLSQDDPRAHSDLGTALLASDDPVRATSELRRAIALDPSRATFHSNLGYALQMQGMRSPAIAEYREALRLDPKLGSAWINLATILARDPHTRVEARAALETAKKLDPTDPRVKANLEELDALEGAPLH